MIMIRISFLLAHTAGCVDAYLAPISPHVSRDLWICQPSPIRFHLTVAQATPPTSHLFFFSSSSPLRFSCWRSRFCCSSSGTSSRLSKWCTRNSRRTKTRRRSCEPPSRARALGQIPLRAPAEPWTRSQGLVRPRFGEGYGLCQRRLSVIQAWLCSPAVYVYLIQSVIAFFFFFLCIEQHAPAQRSASVGKMWDLL